MLSAVLTMTILNTWTHTSSSWHLEPFFTSGTADILKVVFSWDGWYRLRWYDGWCKWDGSWILLEWACLFTCWKIWDTWWYCWWTKSCTTKDDDYPTIHRVLAIPGGAGFCPSTVYGWCSIILRDLKHQTPMSWDGRLQPLENCYPMPLAKGH